MWNCVLHNSVVISIWKSSLVIYCSCAMRRLAQYKLTVQIIRFMNSPLREGSASLTACPEVPALYVGAWISGYDWSYCANRRSEVLVAVDDTLPSFISSMFVRVLSSFIVSAGLCRFLLYTRICMTKRSHQRICLVVGDGCPAISLLALILDFLFCLIAESLRCSSPLFSRPVSCVISYPSSFKAFIISVLRLGIGASFNTACICRILRCSTSIDFSICTLWFEGSSMSKTVANSCITSARFILDRGHIAICFGCCPDLPHTPLSLRLVENIDKQYILWYLSNVPHTSTVLIAPNMNWHAVPRTKET